MKLLVIQPWFSAVGHPAQSLINTAAAIGNDDRVEYLVSINPEFQGLSFLDELQKWGVVHGFSVKTHLGRGNTARALWAAWRLILSGRKFSRIFFFDSSLPVIALLWPVFARLCSVDTIHILHLSGPEHVTRSQWPYRFLIRRLLARADVRFYLRNKELADAWIQIYKDVVVNRISTLPSLEIPDGISPRRVRRPAGAIRFGVLGQVRPGKGLEWLVPLFQGHPELGTLTVAGRYANKECEANMAFLRGFDGFVNRFMPESEMLERSSQQDYLLMLYDGAWDNRMESAVLYLAARVDRPVIVYADSWSGRMVRQFGCGLLAPTGRGQAAEFLGGVPHPETAAYHALLEGMAEFRSAHSTRVLRPLLIEKLFS